MILEYNYDNGNLVLDLLKKSALATLDIQTVTEKKLDTPSKFIMEYTLVSDYPESAQEQIREVLSTSLNERLQVVNLLNQFVEQTILENVNSFSLQFKAVQVRKCRIAYSFSFGTNADVKEPKNNILSLEQCLEQFDHIVTDMGVGAQTIADIFRREGSGRNKKYIPLTIADLAAALRHALTEE